MCNQPRIEFDEFIYLRKLPDYASNTINKTTLLGFLVILLSDFSTGREATAV